MEYVLQTLFLLDHHCRTWVILGATGSNPVLPIYFIIAIYILIYEFTVLIRQIFLQTGE